MMFINNIYGTSLTIRKKTGFQITLPSIVQGTENADGGEKENLGKKNTCWAK